jgi:hypothetical protein
MDMEIVDSSRLLRNPALESRAGTYWEKAARTRWGAYLTSVEARVGISILKEHGRAIAQASDNLTRADSRMSRWQE